MSARFVLACLAAVFSCCAAGFLIFFYYRCRKRPATKGEKIVLAAGLVCYGVFVFVWGILRNLL